MKGDEEPVEDAFCLWLEQRGWSTHRSRNEVDVLATRGDRVIYAEVKSWTGSDMGTDVDTGYGQLLRRMLQEDEVNAEFAMVVPDRAVGKVHRVVERVRAALRIHVYSVTEDGQVSFVGDGVDPVTGD